MSEAPFLTLNEKRAAVGYCAARGRGPAGVSPSLRGAL